jgi:hypothetical protein
MSKSRNQPTVDPNDQAAFINNEGDAIRHRIANMARKAAAFSESEQEFFILRSREQRLPPPSAGVSGLHHWAQVLDAAFGGPAHAGAVESVALDGYQHYFQFGNMRLYVSGPDVSGVLVARANAFWRKFNAGVLAPALAYVTEALSCGDQLQDPQEYFTEGCLLIDQRNYLPLEQEPVEIANRMRVGLDAIVQEARAEVTRVVLEEFEALQRQINVLV